jgi:hypothetical protein
MASNNNVSIHLFGERLYLGWRTAPTHFASTETQMHLVSSPDLGLSWTHEATFSLGKDLREPLLFSVGGVLHFSFFEGGDDALAFEPSRPWRSRLEGGAWTDLEAWGEEGEVPWEVMPHGGSLYLTTYLGPHYDLGSPGEIDVRLFSSPDGQDWSAVGSEASVYHGGASEAAIGFDEDGMLWAVLRNEDGDGTGFGTLLCSAEPGEYGAWDCPEQSDPERYDSPRIFSYGGELYLLGRRDIGGPYGGADSSLSFSEQQIQNLGAYSSRPKRTALYRIDRQDRTIVHLLDLPSSGDTSFPSVVQLDEHRFLVANYSSPLDDLDRSWLEGQVSEEGTGIYLIELEFVED